MINYKVKRFSILGKIKSWANDYNHKHGVRDLEKERQERIQNEKIKKENQEKEFQGISKTHDGLYKTWANTKSLHPSWGDGDEYPSLILNIGYTQGEEDYGGFSLGFQNEPEYKWINNKWVEVNYYGKPRNIPNLKQDILKFLETEIKEWETIHIKYLEKEDVDEVLKYLKALRLETIKNL